DRTVVVSLTLNLAGAPYKSILRHAEATMVELRGTAEMIANRSRVHDLAAVIQKYLADKGHFPPGASALPAAAERAVDRPPGLRHSWLAELVPYLRGDYKEMPREADKPWRANENIDTAQVLVPTFIGRSPPYFLRYPGVGPAVAASHFVGVAGVGFDAAT